MDKNQILEQLGKLKEANPKLKYHHKNKVEKLQGILDAELKRIEKPKEMTKVVIESIKPINGDVISELNQEEPKAYEELSKDYELMVAANASLQAQLQESGTNKPEYTIPEFKSKLNEFREYSIELTGQIRGKCPNSFIAILNNYIRRDLEIATKKLFKRYS